MLFYTPWKHQKTFRSNLNRGYRKATPGCNGLIYLFGKNLRMTKQFTEFSIRARKISLYQKVYKQLFTKFLLKNWSENLRRGLNNTGYKLHERCLRITYNDKKSTFQKLYDKYKSVSIHNRNLQVLATEMLEVTKGLSR